MRASLLVVAVALAGTGYLGAASAATPSRAAAPLLVRCAPATARSLVARLVSAFNRGDARAVDRLVAPEPAFEWFSAGGRTSSARRLGARAKDRSTLAAYVGQRHRHHERWTPIGVGGPAHLELRLRRGADDLPTATGPVKFDTSCVHAHAWIIVWSI